VDGLNNPVTFKVVSDLSGTGNQLLRALLMPAATKAGLAFGNYVDLILTRNLDRLAERAMLKNPNLGVSESTHPRMAIEFIQKAAWIDDETLSEAWAGLMASSATEDGGDESNLNHTNILTQMTPTQARIVNFVYSDARFKHAFNWDEHRKRFLEGMNTQLETKDLAQACGQHDPEQLYVEITRLTGLDILHGMFFSTSTEVVNLAPTRLGAMFYIRCQGSREGIYEYFHGGA
jgi:hypothetical protein